MCQWLACDLGCLRNVANNNTNTMCPSKMLMRSNRIMNATARRKLCIRLMPRAWGALCVLNMCNASFSNDKIFFLLLFLCRSYVGGGTAPTHSLEHENNTFVREKRLRQHQREQNAILFSSTNAPTLTLRQMMNSFFFRFFFLYKILFYLLHFVVDCAWSFCRV